jgi:undecaprenyl pyrophosphate phosphatase UppP
MGLFVLDVAETGLSAFSTPLLAGVATSFLVSLATMHYFLSLARKVDFSGFVIAVGGVAFFIPLAVMAFEWLTQF